MKQKRNIKNKTKASGWKITTNKKKKKKKKMTVSENRTGSKHSLFDSLVS